MSDSLGPGASAGGRDFGRLSDGRMVRAFEIAWPGGLRVEVLDYGAVLRRLSVPTPRGELDVTTSLPSADAYEVDAAYHGALVGRCANRIGGARFELDGVVERVVANEHGNCLHGGLYGFNKHLWAVAEAGPRALRLTRRSEDGEEGFPGAVEAEVAYALTGPDTLEIGWSATTDRATPVNLTSHLYFNLSGNPATDILDHELTVAADAYTPVDPQLIPTGELTPVQGTPFDFRAPRRIGEGLDAPDPQLAPGGGYDHNWALRPGPDLGLGLGPQLRLRSPETGVVLEVETDQPGMQVYGGQGLTSPFIPHGAVVLEPQGFPDAVNRPAFPSVILRPGEIYRRTARYRFTAGAPG